MLLSPDFKLQSTQSKSHRIACVQGLKFFNDQTRKSRLLDGTHR